MPELTFVNGITSKGRLTKNGLTVVRARAARASHISQGIIHDQDSSPGAARRNGKKLKKSARLAQETAEQDTDNVIFIPGPSLQRPGFLAGGSQRAVEKIAIFETHAGFMQAIDILTNDIAPSVVRQSYQTYGATDTGSSQFNAIKLYASVSHTGAILTPKEGSEPKVDAGLATVFKGLRAEVAVPSHEVNQNEVVVTIVMLCLFEMVRWGEYVQLHRKALERIINQYGGPDRVDNGRLVFVISLCDINTSIYLNCSPFWFNLEAPELLPSESSPAIPRHFNSSPLYCLGAFEGATLHNSLVTSASADILRQAFTSFHQLTTHVAASQVDTLASGSTFRTPAKPSQVLDDFDTAVATHYYLNDCISRAASIWWYAIHEQRPFEDTANDADLHAMYTSLTWISWDAWRGLPYVYLWIILVGFATSRTQLALRRFFFAELNRCGLGLAAYNWPLYRHAVNNFLWLQAWLRGDAVPAKAPPAAERVASRITDEPETDASTDPVDYVEDEIVRKINIAGNSRQFPTTILEVNKAMRSLSLRKQP